MLPSFSLTNFQTAVTVGSQTFQAGLVFDSAVYAPLSEVPPVRATDSHVANMQHMAVVKASRIPYYITNTIVLPPYLAVTRAGVLHWTGASDTVYEVQAKYDFGHPWSSMASLSSPDGRLSYTNSTAVDRVFFRVVVRTGN